MAQTFSQLPYTRPDLEAYHQEIDRILEGFDASKSADDHSALIDAWNTLRNHFATMHSLAEVHYTLRHDVGDD